MLSQLLLGPRPFAKELQEKLFEIQKDFYQNDFQNFHLSHLHSVIYLLGKNLDNPNYGEIGSHTGNSAIIAGLSNSKLIINCFDLPDGGWGGSAGAKENLEKKLQENFPNRFSCTFGDSHSTAVKNAITEKGPYDIFLVDGDHSEAGALDDLSFAYTNLKDGGFLIFDDLVHHPYLNDVFNKFLGKIRYKDYIVINDMTQEEADANFVIRGVGILQK